MVLFTKFYIYLKVKEARGLKHLLIYFDAQIAFK